MMPQRHVMAFVKLLFSNLIARNRAIIDDDDGGG